MGESMDKGDSAGTSPGSGDVVITPPLGSTTGPTARCTYEVNGSHCRQPGVAHIIWDSSAENGVTCADHLTAAKQFAYMAIHDLVWACTLPGSRVLFDENTCVMPDDLNPLTLLAEQAMDTEMTVDA